MLATRTILDMLEKKCRHVFLYRIHHLAQARNPTGVLPSQALYICCRKAIEIADNDGECKKVTEISQRSALLINSMIFQFNLR